MALYACRGTLDSIGICIHCRTIEVPDEERAEIRTAFELMTALAGAVRAARAAGRFPLVLAGNCNTAVGTLGGLGSDAAPAVLWFDAHADFNTPETTTPAAASDTPQVVFACVRNGGRSVISRVLTEHYAGGRVVALSAGTQPGDHIHREVADVLGTLGLDTSQEQPKLLTRETIAASTMAITLGCGEECPYVPGVKYTDWPVEDPGGQDEPTVRRIIGDIDGRVRTLLTDLVPDLALPPSVLAS